jgi:hypothetical protein
MLRLHSYNRKVMSKSLQIETSEWGHYNTGVKLFDLPRCPRATTSEPLDVKLDYTLQSHDR